MTTAPLLHSGNKNIEEIYQIVTSTEVANMAWQITGQIADLAMQIMKKSNGRQQQPQPRQKTNEKYFNCKKRRHYAKDYCAATKKKPKDAKANEELKWARWTRNRATKKASAAQSVNQDDLDFKPYPVGRTFITGHPSNNSNSTNT